MLLIPLVVFLTCLSSSTLCICELANLMRVVRARRTSRGAIRSSSTSQTLMVRLRARTPERDPLLHRTLLK